MRSTNNDELCQPVKLFWWRAAQTTASILKTQALPLVQLIHCVRKCAVFNCQSRKNDVNVYDDVESPDLCDHSNFLKEVQKHWGLFDSTGSLRLCVLLFLNNNKKRLLKKKSIQICREINIPFLGSLLFSAKEKLTKLQRFSGIDPSGQTLWLKLCFAQGIEAVNGKVEI